VATADSPAGTGAGRGEQGIRVAETHSAILFFVADRVYKIKKSVELGFLDFRSAERRRLACHDEVRLNRRLAPDVYLGVAEVRGPDGLPCEWIVVMRRLPSRLRLSELVRARARGGDAGPDPAIDLDAQLRALARRLAGLHAAADRSAAIDDAGRAPALLTRWQDNLVVLRAHAPRLLAADAVDRVADRALRYVRGREPLLAARAAAGLVVDGHGDLLADDVFCLPDGPRALDCLDFDAGLRAVDGLDDAAFLAMDLERLGAPELGARFLAWYQEFGGTPAAATLAHHYIAYRAGVRAKVGCLRSDQGGTSAAADARAHLELAERHLIAGEVPLVLVGGLPGTGKSTLAGLLADRLGAVLLRSDVLRKERAGLAAATPAAAGWQRGLYAPAVTATTYRDLLDRAESLLGLGEPVVLDASWSSSVYRSAARSVAARAWSPVVELRCVAPAEVTAERIGRRAGHGDASDADAAVAERMAVGFDPWPEAEELDTTAAPAEVAARAGQLLPCGQPQP
jgi:aminoglycoside phosphotransferase family enzyme/predicted kinase